MRAWEKAYLPKNFILAQFFDKSLGFLLFQNYFSLGNKIDFPLIWVLFKNEVVLGKSFFLKVKSKLRKKIKIKMHES